MYFNALKGRLGLLRARPSLRSGQNLSPPQGGLRPPPAWRRRGLSAPSSPHFRRHCMAIFVTLCFMGESIKVDVFLYCWFISGVANLTLMTFSFFTGCVCKHCRRCVFRHVARGKPNAPYFTLTLVESLITQDQGTESCHFDVRCRLINKKMLPLIAEN